MTTLEGGKKKLENEQPGRIENQVYSNRVVRSEFDEALGNLYFKKWLCNLCSDK